MKAMRLAVAVVAVMGCGVAAAQGIQTKSDGGLKPELRGVIAMGVPRFNVRGGVPTNVADYAALPAGVDAVIINVTWAQLEPEPGKYDLSAVEQALAAIRKHNAEHKENPWPTRLRVFAGQNVAPWVLKEFGAVQVGKKAAPADVTVARFWTPEYSVAYDKLVAMLAARYDSEPLIDEVSLTTCSSVSDEEMNVPLQGDSIANLLKAGYTDEAYLACLKAAPAAYKAWKRTRVDYPFNEFRSISGMEGQAAGTLVKDVKITNALMDDFRNQFGAQATLHNHSLGANSVEVPGRAWSEPAKGLVQVYEHMAKLGPEIEFQQSGPADTNLATAVPQAVHYGATAVEIWNANLEQAKPGQIAAWRGMLKGNGKQD